MKIKKLLLVCMSVVFITACTSTKVEDDKKTNNLKVKYSVEKISDNFDYLKSNIDDLHSAENPRKLALASGGWRRGSALP